MAYEELKALRDQLDKENVYLQEEIKSKYNFEEIIGNSHKLRKVSQGLCSWQR